MKDFAVQSARRGSALRGGSARGPAPLRTGLLLAAAVFLSPPPVSAHDNITYGTSVFVQDGVLHGGGLDSGVVLMEGDQPLWVCSAATGSTVYSWYRTPGGRLLAATLDGLRWSDDGGCSWSAPSGPAGLQPIFSLRAGRSALGSIYATTAAPGLLLRSTDEGLSWEEVLSRPELAFWRAAVSDDGSRVVVVGVSGEGEAELLGSDDGGSTWTASLSLEGWETPVLFDFSDDGTAVFLSAFRLDGDFEVLAAPVGLDGPVEALGDFELFVNGFEDFAGAYSVLTDFQRYERWDGGQERTELEVGAETCLTEIDGVLWGCSGPPLHGFFSQSLDGLEFEGQIFLADVLPRECPEESLAASACPPHWAMLLDMAFGDDDDLGDDDDSASPGSGPNDCDGCAVASASSGASACLLAGLLLVLVSRRRPGRSGHRRSPGDPPRDRSGRTRAT